MGGKYLKIFIASSVFASASILAYGADVPTTQPAQSVVVVSERPSPTSAQARPDSVAPTFRVRGRVSIAGGFAFQQPSLARVVIYVATNAALDTMPLPADRPQVAQRNKRFIPDFVVVARGSTVEFPNWDRFDHNVFSRSKAAPAFDLDRYPYGESKSRLFDKTGVVQVFCNIHPTMRAIIYVTPNQFFTRADAEGRFALDGLPAGDYELVAWNDRCEEQRQAIHVGPGDDREITFALGESRAMALANNPPDHRGGYGVERGLGIKRETLHLPVVKDAHPAPEAKPAR